MKITKRNATEFFVETGHVTADLRAISDLCELVGDVLKTKYKPGFWHTVPPIRITLGQTSFAQVSAMHVGATITLGSSSADGQQPMRERSVHTSALASPAPLMSGEDDMERDRR